MRIELRPSFQLVAVLACAHLAAAGLCIYVLPFWWWGLAVCGAFALAAFWTVRRHALLLHADSVVGFELAGEEGCELRLRNGQGIAARMLPSTYVALWLIVLDLEIPGRRLRRRAVIWPDSLPEDLLRRLRVRLRWTSLAASRAEGAEASL